MGAAACTTASPLSVFANRDSGLASRRLLCVTVNQQLTQTLLHAPCTPHSHMLTSCTEHCMNCCSAAAAAAAQGVLRRIISRRMVEPQRRFFDLHRLYMNKHIARVSARQAWWGCRMSWRSCQLGNPLLSRQASHMLLANVANARNRGCCMPYNRYCLGGHLPCNLCCCRLAALVVCCGW